MSITLNCKEVCESKLWKKVKWDILVQNKG